MKTNGRYHVDVLWDMELKEKSEDLIENLKTVYMSYHAKLRFIQRNRHCISYDTMLKVISEHKHYMVYSADYTNGRVWAVACRFDYTDKFDVIAIVTKEGKILTCWLNKKDDYHDNLDVSKYVGGDVLKRAKKIKKMS